MTDPQHTDGKKYEHLNDALSDVKSGPAGHATKVPPKSSVPDVASELKEKLEALIKSAREVAEHFVGRALDKGEEVIRQFLGRS